MTIGQLRAARDMTPFIPFKIRLVDGPLIPVPHRDFLMIPPTSSRTFVIATASNVYRIVDLFLVSALEFDHPTPAKNGQHRPGGNGPKRRRNS